MWRRRRAVAAHATRQIFETKDLAAPRRRATARGRMRADAKRARVIKTRAREAIFFREILRKGHRTRPADTDGDPGKPC